MNLQLIKGNFTTSEALDLLNQLVLIKIRYHEHKIDTGLNEEDIKMREQRIKQLQNEYQKVRQEILANGGTCELDAEIKIH